MTALLFHFFCAEHFQYLLLTAPFVMRSHFLKASGSQLLENEFWILDLAFSRKPLLQSKAATDLQQRGYPQNGPRTSAEFLGQPHRTQVLCQA